MSVLTAVQAQGYDQVAALNSDSPAIPPGYLTAAFAALDEEETDAVFGPSDDGGYYLIGWKRPYTRLLREVTMSTSHVLADTLAIARQEHIILGADRRWGCRAGADIMKQVGRAIRAAARIGALLVRPGLPFEPLLPGMVHLPFADLEALDRAMTDQTAAVILEPIQGRAGGWAEV